MEKQTERQSMPDSNISVDIHSIGVNTEMYKIFYYVAKEGNISKTAKRLFITQPAVSRTVRQLEEKMGCMLFFRTPKGVRLTGEGEILFNYVEQAFNYLFMGEKKLSQMKNLESGELSVGVGDTICKHYLIPYLKQFNEAYPGIRITNHKTFDIIDRLKRGEIDLSIVNLPLEDDQLRITKVLDIHDCFVAGEKYRRLSEKPIALSEMIRYPILLLERGSNSRKCIDEYFQNNGILIEPDFELGNFELLAEFAKIDFGIACLIREFFLEELGSRQLYEIPVKEPIPARGIGVVSLKVVPLSAAARALIELLMHKRG